MLKHLVQGYSRQIEDKFQKLKLDTLGTERLRVNSKAIEINWSQFKFLDN